MWLWDWLIVKIRDSLDIHGIPTPRRSKPKALGTDADRYINIMGRYGLAVREIENDDLDPAKRYFIHSEETEHLTLSLNEDGEMQEAFVINLSLKEASKAEKGNPGLRWSRGLPSGHEENQTFTPVKARGRNGKLGLYHKYFVSSTTYRRAWSNIAQSQVTGLWRIKPPEWPNMTDEEREEASERARIMNLALTQIEGGWSQFCKEAMYCLIGGFSIFEEVFHGKDTGELPAGAIRKVAFRFPASVNQWVMDSNERDLTHVEFTDGDGVTYMLPADQLLLISYDRFGNNFEGISPMRSVARWIEALQLCQRIELVSAEKFGSPWTYIRRSNDQYGGANTTDLQNLHEIVDEAIAVDDPVIVLPDNVEIQTTSPSGHMPNFEPIKRFCIERITEILKAEGSLIGLGVTGAYAARQTASDELIRSAPYYAKLITDAMNGADNTPYTGTIPKMERAIWGGPIKPGHYCQLTYSVGELEDPAWVERLAAAIAAGMVVVTPELQAWVHDKMNIPEPPEDVPATTVATIVEPQDDAA